MWDTVGVKTAPSDELLAASQWACSPIQCKHAENQEPCQ